jgi:hypothetical protein
MTESPPPPPDSSAEIHSKIVKFIEGEPPRTQPLARNRTLSAVELREIFAPLFADVKARLDGAAAGDTGMLFALRRKLSKELEYLERGKPMHRRAIKRRKFQEQGGLCAECGRSLGDEAELDRNEAILGYTIENTRLIHHECHRKVQLHNHFA